LSLDFRCIIFVKEENLYMINLTDRLKQHALKHGIDLIGITSAKPFIIQKDIETIFDPKQLLDDAKAIIVTGFYMKEKNIVSLTEPIKPTGRYNSYNVKAFMPMTTYYIKTIQNFLKNEGYRVLFDNDSRIPYKIAAVRAGLGKYGKSTVVITEQYGSFVMFVPLITNAPLDYEEFSIDETECGNCEICIKSCPTQAIYAPFQLNRDLCITHWLWGNFAPINLREKQENRLFGCGECVKACPKNKKFEPRDKFPVPLEDVSDNPELIPLITANKKYFQKVIASFPLLAGTEAIRGNAIIALGNIADISAISALEQTLKHFKPMIRAYSAWALSRIEVPNINIILKNALLTEKDRNVIKEVQYAINYDEID
jgi:epoxyqueuosine reductase